jgi:hypothetical protein
MNIIGLVILAVVFFVAGLAVGARNNEKVNTARQAAEKKIGEGINAIKDKIDESKKKK